MIGFKGNSSTAQCIITLPYGRKYFSTMKGKSRQELEEKKLKNKKEEVRFGAID
jgi:hypothetical protein